MACVSISFTNPGDLAGTSFTELSGLEADQFQPQIGSKHIFEDIVGKSPALQKVLEHVAIVARTDSTGLVDSAETRSKELVGRGIHNLSARRRHTLVSMNC